ncbi:MAG TPA: hypothetical protein VII49_01925 [Rhizomicrobium sp.]
MNATVDPGEPGLSADFTQRVLRRADIIIARRRRMRRVGVASAAAVVLILVIVSGTRMLSPEANAPRTQPDEIAGADAGGLLAAPSGRTDPLSYMFPDAAPVARLAERYSDDTDDSGDLLFADDRTETDETPD